jgi:hypothetical protein
MPARRVGLERGGDTGERLELHHPGLMHLGLMHRGPVGIRLVDR